MNISRATIVATMALFLSGIGADNCGIGWSMAPVMDQAPPPPKPFCLFDPPVGCGVTCLATGEADFTPQCEDVSASVLTAKFEAAAVAAEAAAMMQGIPVCTPESVGRFVSPCAFGIEPQPNPPESQDVCMNPPPHCGGL